LNQDVSDKYPEFVTPAGPGPSKAWIPGFSGKTGACSSMALGTPSKTKPGSNGLLEVSTLEMRTSWFRFKRSRSRRRIVGILDSALAPSDCRKS
jgi:hypothetical protein